MEFFLLKVSVAIIGAVVAIITYYRANVAYEQREAFKADEKCPFCNKVKMQSENINFNECVAAYTCGTIAMTEKNGIVYYKSRECKGEKD